MSDEPEARPSGVMTVPGVAGSRVERRINGQIVVTALGKGEPHGVAAVDPAPEVESKPKKRRKNAKAEETAETEETETTEGAEGSDETEGSEEEDETGEAEGTEAQEGEGGDDGPEVEIVL